MFLSILNQPCVKLGVIAHLVASRISNGNRTEWSTIQGVIGRVISNQTNEFEITSTNSYYQLITVSITKCEKLFNSTTEKGMSKSKEIISE